MKKSYKLYVAIWLVLFVLSLVGLVKSGSFVWIIAVVILAIVALACAVTYMRNYMNNVDTSSDFKLKAQTSFIRLTTADAAGYMEKAQNDEVRESCKKVYEALRYADPMSTETIQDIEHQISGQMFALGEAVRQNNVEQVKEAAKEVINLVGDRERVCKALK